MKYLAWTLPLLLLFGGVLYSRVETLKERNVAQGHLAVEDIGENESVVSGVIRETIQANPAEQARRAADVLVPDYSTFTLGDLDAALNDFDELLRGKTELQQHRLLDQKMPLFRTRSIGGIAFVTQVNVSGIVFLRPSSAKKDRPGRTFFAQSALPLETLELLRPNQQVRIACEIDKFIGTVVWLNCDQITPL
jgi:hypothetical protein